MNAGHARMPPSEEIFTICACGSGASAKQRNRRLRAQKLRLQIRVHDAVPLLFGQRLEFGGEEDSRVVDQNVEPGKFLFHGGEQLP